jgi:DNA-directed RNA polymerase subunit RPC12/RpoP
MEDVYQLEGGHIKPVKSGDIRCPECNGGDDVIQDQGISYNGGTVYLDLRCKACGMEWIVQLTAG